MRVRLLVDTAIRGEPVQAGEVYDVPDDDLWRLIGRYECLLADRPAASGEIEERDPEPGHRDPKGKKK